MSTQISRQETSYCQSSCATGEARTAWLFHYNGITQVLCAQDNHKVLQNQIFCIVVLTPKTHTHKLCAFNANL